MKKILIKVIMRKRQFNLMSLLIFIIFLSVQFVFTSCEREGQETTYKIYEEKMIDEILEENELSEFLAIIDYAKFRGTIHAYGNYTLFVPSNNAIQNYLQSIGKSSVNDLSSDEAVEIIKFHLIPDSIPTSDFEEGRLSTINFAHRYLTNKPVNIYGKSTYLINRQANIITSNLHGANGYIHIIDKVLTPPTQTITDLIQSLPESEYSLMKLLFSETSWVDTFSVVQSNRNYTFFIQSNEAFAKSGINSKEELLELLHKNTPTVVSDTLIYNYIGYHGINRQQYTLDLMRSSAIESLIKGQVLMFKAKSNSIIVNELIMPKVTEEGVPLLKDSEYSNYSCSNGVVHEINGNITIKNRAAYRVYWDIAEQPEIMALKIFRKGGSATFLPGDLSEITWGGKSPQPIVYDSWALPKTLGTDMYTYNDRLRFRMSTKLNGWMELKTPVLVGGKNQITGEDGISYKVWLGYRRTSSSILKTIFKQDGKEDQVLPYVFKMSDYMPSLANTQPEVALSQGWKQYTGVYSSIMCMHLLGTIKVYTTGRHILRLESTNDGTEGWYDMVQFIPVDEDQIWPRIDMAGKWIDEGMQDCEIYPYSDCNANN
ncbi:MAG: fasciclin domain-containing protein [Paludibacter sp.]|nr:fasciclin domain-containing protein [Paludibacter sp.]